jgi:hypothetical protein
MVCHDGIDCPPGHECEGGRCVPTGSCCDTIRCPPGSTCDHETCGCGAAEGCCATGECADPRKYCEWETCGCVDIPVCDPPCEGETICEWGECIPRCWAEGCPDPSMICGEAGCVPRACTAEECFAMGLRCDPYVGCGDPCATDDWRWCTDSGGMCYLGECIDPTCGAGSGTPSSCNYVADCCGDWHCQEASEPPPPCPFFCPPDAGGPMPDPGMCLCGMGGVIIVDPPEPGGAGGGEPGMGGGGEPGGGEGGGGGGPDGPPPPIGRVYCVDLRDDGSSGGGPRPGPEPMPFPGEG